MNDALNEIAANLSAQDNECTAEPIFVVQTRRRLYGFDTQYCEPEQIVWRDSECEADTDRSAQLEAQYEKTGEEPEGWYRTGFMDTWEFVQPFFTRVAADLYIEANRHRMKDPRVFVDSAYRNKEWQVVRSYLRTLLPQAAETPK